VQYDHRCTMRKATGGDEQLNIGSGLWPTNWLVPILLLMLREWSSYGYELLDKMAAFGIAAMNRGTLYRVLRQMEKDGMVISTWDTSVGGPARRMYSITQAGEAYLKLWADSLDQYQTLVDTLVRLYTGQPARSKARADE
jgi:PadR family transcriptional regulator, regulatory protein PadR